MSPDAQFGLLSMSVMSCVLLVFVWLRSRERGRWDGVKRDRRRHWRKP